MFRTQDLDPEFPFQLDHPAIAEPAPAPAPACPRVRTSEAAVLAELELTQEKADAISQIAQGSQEWLNARKSRITASNFGAAIGLNKYKSARGLLKDLLWNTFKGNAATRWGSEHEDVARDAYVAQMQAEIDAGVSEYTSIRVEETGLHVNPARPWLGSSPDGVVHVTRGDGSSHKFLLEIKCPFRKQFYDPPVPTYYNCQIQGVMANMGLPYCDFVVWTPSGMQITRVDFDAKFWDTTLFPGLHKFYHKMYLPLLVAKHNGELEEGQTCIVLRL
jgi:putative phage-type endonuclease